MEASHHHVVRPRANGLTRDAWERRITGFVVADEQVAQAIGAPWNRVAQIVLTGRLSDAIDDLQVGPRDDDRVAIAGEMHEQLLKGGDALGETSPGILRGT